MNLSFRLPLERHKGETRIHHVIEQRFINTRNHHRAPAFVTRWSGDLADLRREIGAVHAAVDLLAAVISGQEVEA